jgi:hypothetical protein
MTSNNGMPRLTARYLRPGWHIYWRKQTYRIQLLDEDTLILHVEDPFSHETSPLPVKDLMLVSEDGQSPPLFAPTLERLLQEIESLQSLPEGAPDSGLPPKLLERADEIISVVQQVEETAKRLRNRIVSEGEKCTQADALRQACALVGKVGLTVFYAYRKRCRQGQWDRVQIASSLRRKTYHKTRQSSARLHFLDTVITRYYRADRPSTPILVYRIAESALKFHTQSRWVDPDKCKKGIPQDLVEELCLVLDEKLPMQAVRENPEKDKLLAEITMPARGYFYQYLKWFQSQPDQGRKVMNDRYGKGTWENIYLVFDSFVYQATFPLQYVFADHYLLDVFTVDEATRSKISRLWVTVLIDAYSRCIVGMALLDEDPCIESIQSALLHAIWPKKSHLALGIAGEWSCYGIPLQLFLDNAWAHHSHSLENVARVIGQNGKYNTIDLVFRPPYKARYGAIVETYFGWLSNRIKQLLPGAIPSSHPRHVSDAAKKACLLYGDVNRFLQESIVEYNHTWHSALKMTPHQKWMEGMKTGFPLVPPLTEKVKRQFLHLLPSTRQMTAKGICVFGMHYTSAGVAEADKIGRDGQPIAYSIRYDPANISKIALFREDAWIDDIGAKELRLPDGSQKAISLWEVETAKALAREESGDTRDWLAYVNRADELAKRRRSEKRRRQVELQKGGNAGSSEPGSGGQERASVPADDLTELLADFQS